MVIALSKSYLTIFFLKNGIIYHFDFWVFKICFLCNSYQFPIVGTIAFETNVVIPCLNFFLILGGKWSEEAHPLDDHAQFGNPCLDSTILRLVGFRFNIVSAEAMFDDKNPTITDEERARISHNFRAAKALLARKRPRLFHSPQPISQCSCDSHSANQLPHRFVIS